MSALSSYTGQTHLMRQIHEAHYYIGKAEEHGHSNLWNSYAPILEMQMQMPCRTTVLASTITGLKVPFAGGPIGKLHEIKMRENSKENPYLSYWHGLYSLDAMSFKSFRGNVMRSPLIDTLLSLIASVLS